MSEGNHNKKNFYFSTRDLLIMTVLAALGGVASTYINTLGDAVQAALGFAGGTQWAAGLHVIWIVLSVGILRKPGTGTLTGILKGFVELLSGNSHGVIILLVDLVAGLLVDFGFMIFPKISNLLPYLVAGGLATGSNVLVFQIFATLPENILGYTAIAILFFVAFASGIVFAGIIPYGLVKALAKGGVVDIPEEQEKKRKVGWTIILGIAALSILFTVFLKLMLSGPQQIEISGAAENTYNFPNSDIAISEVSKKMDYRGVMTEFRGYPLAEIIEYAQPVTQADTILLEASDGYAFLISFGELQSNPNILLVQNGSGNKASFDIVGPISSKAWVRNLTKITIVAAEGLKITNSSGESETFNPDQWLNDMDSTRINLASGSQKLQGVALWKIVEYYQGDLPPSQVLIKSPDQLFSLSWSEINQNNDIRLFTVIEEERISFVLAEMSGNVLAFPVTGIEIN